MCYTSGTTGMPKGVVYSHRSTVLHTFGSQPGTRSGSASPRARDPAGWSRCSQRERVGLPDLAAMLAEARLPGPALDPESCSKTSSRRA